MGFFSTRNSVFLLDLEVPVEILQLCAPFAPLGLEGFAYIVPCRQKGVCSWCGTFEFRQCISGFDSWWRGA